jgi:hypothetical protein
VIHASHAGPFNGFFSPDLADLPYDSVYLGETMIVDADGQILSRRDARQGAGIVVSDIVIPQQAAPSLEIPEAFWTPSEMPEPWKDSWQRWFESGAYYYDTVTKPYVQTGKVKEFIPAYML